LRRLLGWLLRALTTLLTTLLTSLPTLLLGHDPVVGRRHCHDRAAGQNQFAN
jgi:hypothetical protein